MHQSSIVLISSFGRKELKKLPLFIQEAVAVWAMSVEEEGIRKVRQLPGYHDEPLQGALKGLRSVRLNRAYRLMYKTDEDHNTITITVLKVNHHDYK